MRTATEVGGDYYDFRITPDGALVAAVGDATGHGARAGTMVTVIKSLFSAHPPEGELGEFLGEANDTVRKMELGRMAMALCLARFDNGRMTFSSAGMPPALVRRAASGQVEELTTPGMPLGGLADGYGQLAVDLVAGDMVVLMSDGLPELPDADGEPLGYERVSQLVAETASGTPQRSDRRPAAGGRGLGRRGAAERRHHLRGAAGAVAPKTRASSLAVLPPCLTRRGRK